MTAAARADRAWPAGWPVLAAAPLLVLAAIWAPEFRHYHVATPELAAEAAAAMRSSPADAVLARLDGLRYGLEPAVAPDAVARAEDILQGRFRTLGGAVLPLRLEPDDAGLVTGSPGDQLEIGSMAPADTLLAAYRLTGDERYFEAALRSVLAWGRYERAAWAPHGFLWNDHAVAARVLVLASLWRQYRQHPGYRPEVAAQILSFAARSTAMLARPDHYTARTNHGIMQDLALLHAAAAFPALPGAAAHARLALERLGAHLPYYVSPGGIVLEHSTGYQDFAIHLLGTALVYIDLLDLPPPAGLATRYAAAECWQRRVTRPDGSVPLYGDTWMTRRAQSVVAGAAGIRCPAPAGAALDPEFGYAVLDDFGGAGQRLFMAWANFAGRAHKHDDELAAWLWAGGQDWWAASGYWPYGDAAREAAVSWRGSNAPHRAGEGGGQGGSSVLRGHSLVAPLQFLDVERRAADGVSYRRQLFGIDGVGVVVLDSSGGAVGGSFGAVWTLPPGARLEQADAGQWRVAGPAGGYAAAFAAPAGLSVARLHGSRQPFGGLVALNSTIAETDALEVAAPAGSWMLAAWGTGPVSALRLLRWDDAEHWTLAASTPRGAIELVREAAQLRLAGAGAPAPAVVAIEAPPGRRPQLEQAERAYREALQRFPPYRDLHAYRVRASLGVGALAILQFPGLWLLAGLGAGHRWPLLLVTLGWAGLGGWLYYLYLV